MPRNALRAGVVDRIARAADIGALLANLVSLVILVVETVNYRGR